MISNNLFTELQEKIRSTTKLKVTGDYGDLSVPIDTFKHYDINTIEDLLIALEKYATIILTYASISISTEHISGLGTGTPIHTLAEILQLENNNIDLYQGNYDEFTSFEDAKELLSSIKRKINKVT